MALSEINGCTSAPKSFARMIFPTAVSLSGNLSTSIPSFLIISSSLSKVYFETNTPFEFPHVRAPVRLLPLIGVLITETSKLSVIKSTIPSKMLGGVIAIFSVADIETPRFGLPPILILLIINLPIQPR